MCVVMGEFLTVFRYQKKVNKKHIWLFSLRNWIFRIFHSKKSRLKGWFHIFGNVRIYNVILFIAFPPFYWVRQHIMTFWFFGACRLNGKSLICFMACLIRALLSSSPQLFLSLACLLACTQSPQSPMCFFTHINHFPLPFWESYFPLQQQQYFLLFHSLSLQQPQQSELLK